MNAEKAEKKKRVSKPEPQIRFVVKTKGYNETFESIDKARNQYDLLRKRAVKNKQEVKIQLFSKEKNSLELIDEVKISEDFFED